MGRAINKANNPI